MSHVETIRRVLLDAEMSTAPLDALVAENRQQAEELRLRAESQIPVIPKGAQRKMKCLEAEVQQQADLIAWLEGDVAQRRIENQRLRDTLEGWLLFVMEYIADPEASAHIAANEELAVLTTDRTPNKVTT